MADENYTLLMQLGPKQGEKIAVLGEEFVLGRDPSSDWAIEDIEVSRRHARLLLQDGDYAIEDLGSTNGTFVNGQRIRTVLPLLPGATIRLGENVLLFFDSDAGTEKDSDTKTLQVEMDDPPPPESQPDPAPQAQSDAPIDEVEIKEEAPPPAPEPEPQAEEMQPSPTPEPEPKIQEMQAPPPQAAPIQSTRSSFFGDRVGLSIAVIAIVAVLVVSAFLWYVDANFLWCDVFGNLIPACR